MPFTSRALPPPIPSGPARLNVGAKQAQNLIFWAPLDGYGGSWLLSRDLYNSLGTGQPNGISTFEATERGYSWVAVDGTTANDLRFIDGVLSVTTPPLTLSAWAMWDGVTTGYVATLGEAIGANNNRAGFAITSGNWAGELRRTAGNSNNSGIAAVAGEWVHLAVSMSTPGANPWQFFVNGQRFSDSGSVPDTLNILRIANRTDGSSRGYSGQIRDVRVYAEYFETEDAFAGYDDTLALHGRAPRTYFLGDAGPVIIQGSAQFDGAGTLSVTPDTVVISDAQFDGAGTLTLSPVSIGVTIGDAEFTGAGGMTVTPTYVAPEIGAAEFTGSASLTLSVTYLPPAGPIIGTARFDGFGTMSVTPTYVPPVTGDIDVRFGDSAVQDIRFGDGTITKVYYGDTEV